MWRRGRRRCGLPGMLVGLFLAGSVSYDVVNSRHPLATLTRLVRGPGRGASAHAKPWEVEGEDEAEAARPRRKHLHPDDGPEPPLEEPAAGEPSEKIDVFQHKRALAHPGADVGHLRGGHKDPTTMAEVEVHKCPLNRLRARNTVHAHNNKPASMSRLENTPPPREPSL